MTKDPLSVEPAPGAVVLRLGDREHLIPAQRAMELASEILTAVNRARLLPRRVLR